MFPKLWNVMEARLDWTESIAIPFWTKGRQTFRRISLFQVAPKGLASRAPQINDTEKKKIVWSKQAFSLIKAT